MEVDIISPQKEGLISHGTDNAPIYSFLLGKIYAFYNLLKMISVEKKIREKTLIVKQCA